MSTRMQQRRGTATQWATANPVLGAGELGWETDSNKFKIGDGINTWDDLAYFLDEDALGGSIDDYVPLTQKGAANGVATLNASAKIPSEQLDIDELSQDAVNTALTAGTGITKTYNDNANTITVAVDTATIAPLASPTFTGTPVAPTAAPGTNTTQIATTAFVSTAISNLVDSAPETLNTLNELAAALNDDANFVTTIQNQIDNITVTSTVVSSNITLSRGKFFINTSAARTLTLPATPVVGTEIELFDASNLAATNNVTIQANGEKIDGIIEDVIIDVNAFVVGFVYTGSTYGWRMV